jgi:hypothetical protein
LFLESKAHGEPWDEGRTCRSCKLPIGPADPVEELRFEDHGEHKLAQMNGAYHASCARPYLSIKRALDMLGRLPFD